MSLQAKADLYSQALVLYKARVVDLRTPLDFVDKEVG